MKPKNDYGHFNFEQTVQRFPKRFIPVIVSVLISGLCWMLLPVGALLMLLMILIPTLMWIATYGWRSALSDLIRFLQNLLKR